MAFYSLTNNFDRFFGRINPSATFTATAKSQHETIRGLIENPFGAAAVLRPTTFLQGSYKQVTAIDTINDIDIVVLCEELSFGGPPGPPGQTWPRDRIFDTIAAPLLADGRYAQKVRYGRTSMCIKIDLGIKVEILPVTLKYPTTDSSKEPFMLYRPQSGQWSDGYARYHQQWLSWKNAQANRNFIPMVKVLKHLRSLHNVPAVSFHLECLLFRVDDAAFSGAPADYIPNVLEAIAKTSALVWAILDLKTPCGERSIFGGGEWDYLSWFTFHTKVMEWAALAREASSTLFFESYAIQKWQQLLGPTYFPANTGLGGLGGLGLGFP